MKGFEMKDGDLVIVKGEMTMIEGKELTAQTLQSVLSTNEGEWLFDPDEGIKFSNILGQRSDVDESIIRAEIEKAIEQVDSSMTLDNIECNIDKNTRALAVGFTATTEDDEEISATVKY
jgi:phage baseplate assembly protein W